MVLCFLPSFWEACFFKFHYQSIHFSRISQIFTNHLNAMDVLNVSPSAVLQLSHWWKDSKDSSALVAERPNIPELFSQCPDLQRCYNVTSCFRMLRKRTKKQHQGNLKNGWHKVDRWHSFSETFGDKRLRDSNSVCGNNLRSDLNKLQHTRYPAITYVVSIQVVAVTIKTWSRNSLTETVQEETQWSLPYL